MKNRLASARSTLMFTALLSAGALTFAANPAQAYLEFNGFYLSDGLTAASTTTSSKMFIEGSIGFSIDKKGNYLAGWNYSMYNTSDTATATTTYASTQMGPRFLFMLDKNQHWSLGVGYYLVTNAKSNDGTNELTWKGQAFKVDVGYSMELNETVLMGLRLNYSMATYQEQLVSETNYSKVGYSRTHLFPSFYTMVRF